MSRHLVLFSLFACLILALVDALAIDNGIVDAQLMCTETKVELHVSLRRPIFQPARVFVKGHTHDAACALNYFPTGESHNQLVFQVPLGACGMERASQNTGVRSSTYIITYVVSLHRVFITKVDRAYRLICNYGLAAADASAAISVSMLPTTLLPSAAFGAPQCSYTVHAEHESSPQLDFARIGDKVVHVWRCNNLTPNQFVWVRDCVVSPEYGNGEQIVDARGCSVDPVLISELEYGAHPHHTVRAHNHAYKFAEHPTVLFRCSIAICDRQQQQGCFFPDGSVVSVPPLCRRQRRDLGPAAAFADDVASPASSPVAFDLVSEPIEVLQLRDRSPFHDHENGNAESVVLAHEREKNACFCLGGPLLATSLAVLAVLFAASLVICVLIGFNRRKQTAK